MRKITALLAAIICCGAMLTACSDKGNTNEESKQESSASESTEPDSQGEKITGTTKRTVSNEEKGDGKIIAVPALTKAEKRASEKKFNIAGVGNILLDVDWSVISGGADSDIPILNEYPIVLQYKTGVDTCTITVEDGCETAETFAANTVESYKSAFGAAFDSIDIDDFERINIDGIDSFKIEAEVVSQGIEFEMLHILSNAENSNKTVSIMFLDKSGETEDIFDDFEKKKLEYNQSFIRGTTTAEAAKERIRSRTRARDELLSRAGR